MDFEKIREAAAILRSGGVVAFPTETVYGLGANALDGRAAARIFELKARPRFNPLIVHVPTAEKARALATEFPLAAETLARHFWPGPLTLVVPRVDAISDVVTAGLPTVGLRVPNHPVALKLLEEADLPIAAPSANPFMTVSPTTAEHVREKMGERVPVLDGGPTLHGVESTIVGFDAAGRPLLLRVGAVPRESLEAIVGPLGRPDPDVGPIAPGMLSKHYGTTTPMAWRTSTDAPPGVRAGLLTLNRPGLGFAATEVLSPSGDLREAATQLFAAMRRLDDLGLDVILADPFPDEGLGAAIRDRLTRAIGVSPV